ncbi:MAG: hypothetical protein ACYTG0_01460 [Planctomycetota bacterium]
MSDLLQTDRLGADQGQLPATVEKPERMEIHGEDRSLEALLEEFAGHWEISDWNRVQYRERWKRFLPKVKRRMEGEETILNADWCVAYAPIVAVRKCYPTNLGACQVKDLPYFVVILNYARDQRPRQDESPQANGKDPLQRNLIDKEMIIAEFGSFLLTPNGYPYHRYASLLIAKDHRRRQEYPTPNEIETWMRFSILTKQYVFFNSEHAGASIPARMHAQVVDPEGIRCEDKAVVYPILNDRIVERIPVRDGVDILKGYGIEVLALRGRDAPHRASLAVRKLRDEQGHWYNIMVKEKEVYIAARNAEKETSHCIGKKVGAYEISGVVLVGNIEEPLLEKLDLDRTVSGADIFSQLNYEQIASNIANATTSLGGLEHNL